MSTTVIIRAVLLGFVILSFGCQSPDFGWKTDLNTPQRWANLYFHDVALRLVNGEDELLFFDECTSVRVWNNPVLTPSQFLKTLLRTCDRLDAIDEKYGYVEVSMGKEFLENNDALYTESWANEIGAAIRTLDHELVCGEAKEYFYDNKHKCRDVESIPILTADFAAAVNVVHQYLEDSMHKAETLEHWKTEVALLRDILKNPQWEQHVPAYAGRGEWEVLLKFRIGDRGHIERFRVLNEPGRWLPMNEESDAGYPAVIHCGSIPESSRRGFRVRSSTLRVWDMDIDLYDSSNTEPCRWGT